MANPEHLEILKQGVKVWNEWRKARPNVLPDLRGLRLEGAQLKGADFRDANLGALSIEEDESKNGEWGVWCTNLTYSDLSEADFEDANLSSAFFSNSNLSRANLSGTDLNTTNFPMANLAQADLEGASLIHSNLRGAIFREARLGGTTFGDVDLSVVEGLDRVIHDYPSIISIDTFYRSAGKIPEDFLRGCGLSDWQVESAKLYLHDLSSEDITTILYRVHALRAGQAIQISPLFISYSHANGDFVDAVESHLNERGVRFWRDVHHSTAGRLETQIDRAIRLNPTVLLVLSEHSVRSDWVEHEARLARKLEQETGRDVLCPVALDDSWKTCRWPERLREQIREYKVLDFSSWQDPDYMRRMFSRLIEGLGLFYK